MPEAIDTAAADKALDVSPEAQLAEMKALKAEMAALKASAAKVEEKKVETVPAKVETVEKKAEDGKARKQFFTEVVADANVAKPDSAAVADYKLEQIKGGIISIAELQGLEKSSKSLGLDKAKAQQLAAEYNAIKKAEVDATNDKWYDELVADPELGGENLAKTQALLQKAMRHVNTKTRGLFANSPFANHKEFIRALTDIAKALPSEAKTTVGTPVPQKTEPKSWLDHARKLYPDKFSK